MGTNSDRAARWSQRGWFPTGPDPSRCLGHCLMAAAALPRASACLGEGQLALRTDPVHCMSQTHRDFMAWERTATAERKREGGARQPGALPWGCHGHQRTHRRTAPPSRHQLWQCSFPQMFWGPGTPGFGPLLLPSHECPQRRDPPPRSSWAPHHEMGAVGRDIQGSFWDSGHQPFPCLPLSFSSKMRLLPSAARGSKKYDSDLVLYHCSQIFCPVQGKL